MKSYDDKISLMTGGSKCKYCNDTGMIPQEHPDWVEFCDHCPVIEKMRNDNLMKMLEDANREIKKLKSLNTQLRKELKAGKTPSNQKRDEAQALYQCISNDQTLVSISHFESEDAFYAYYGRDNVKFIKWIEETRRDKSLRI